MKKLTPNVTLVENQAPHIKIPVSTTFLHLCHIRDLFQMQRGAESDLNLEVGAMENRIVQHNQFREVVLLC